MSRYFNDFYEDDYVAHHADGSLTAEGRNRYGYAEERLSKKFDKALAKEKKEKKQRLLTKLM